MTTPSGVFYFILFFLFFFSTLSFVDLSVGLKRAFRLSSFFSFPLLFFTPFFFLCLLLSVVCRLTHLPCLPPRLIHTHPSDRTPTHSTRQLIHKGTGQANGNIQAARNHPSQLGQRCRRRHRWWMGPGRLRYPLSSFLPLPQLLLLFLLYTHTWC